MIITEGLRSYRLHCLHPLHWIATWHLLSLVAHHGGGALEAAHHVALPASHATWGEEWVIPWIYRV